jgi:hypothetical protein
MKKKETANLFPNAQVVVTARLDATLALPMIGACLVRHNAGDWGEACRSERATNDANLKSGDQIFSIYSVAGVKVWVITDPGHLVTTLMTPEDY